MKGMDYPLIMSQDLTDTRNNLSALSQNQNKPDSDKTQNYPVSPGGI